MDIVLYNFLILIFNIVFHQQHDVRKYTIIGTNTHTTGIDEHCTDKTNTVAIIIIHSCDAMLCYDMMITKVMDGMGRYIYGATMAMASVSVYNAILLNNNNTTTLLLCYD